MAKAGDKRRLAENSARLRTLKLLIVGANATFIVTRFILQRQQVLSWYGGALALTTALYAFCYAGIAAALAPHYSASGELIYAGADLKTGGVLSYYHDVVYLAIFSQIAGAWTNWAWLALALVPAYAAWALATKVLLPSWGSSKDEGIVPETEMERKRREKRERQAARGRKICSSEVMSYYDVTAAKNV